MGDTLRGGTVISLDAPGTEEVTTLARKEGCSERVDGSDGWGGGITDGSTDALVGAMPDVDVCGLRGAGLDDNSGEILRTPGIIEGEDDPDGGAGKGCVGGRGEAGSGEEPRRLDREDLAHAGSGE
jgi:hypothetical protein